MLVLSRREGESIIIDTGIEVIVRGTRGGSGQRDCEKASPTLSGAQQTSLPGVRRGILLARRYASAMLDGPRGCRSQVCPQVCQRKPAFHGGTDQPHGDDECPRPRCTDKLCHGGKENAKAHERSSTRHHVGTVRHLQGVSLRTISRNWNVDDEEVRGQQQDTGPDAQPALPQAADVGRSRRRAAGWRGPGTV